VAAQLPDVGGHLCGCRAEGAVGGRGDAQRKRGGEVPDGGGVLRAAQLAAGFDAQEKGAAHAPQRLRAAADEAGREPGRMRR